jgi:hypothetical protein
VTTNRPVQRRIGTALPIGLLCLSALLAVTSGCSSAASGASGGTAATASAVPSAYATPSGIDCGTARTVINTPVVIKVTKGSVSCTTALSVEDSYTQLLKQAITKNSRQGNGGGAPVAVNGWTCQGYPTPEVLTNGVTSECHTASADVVAVLDLGASASPTS